MTKKVTIKDRKFNVKFPENITINGAEFKKGTEYEVKIDDVTDKEFEHKKSVFEKDVKGKLVSKKEKDADPDSKEIQIKLKGDFDNGYFYDSIKVKELDFNGTAYKVEEQDVKIGSDLFGVNY